MWLCTPPSLTRPKKCTFWEIICWSEEKDAARNFLPAVILHHIISLQYLSRNPSSLIFSTLPTSPPPPPPPPERSPRLCFLTSCVPPTSSRTNDFPLSLCGTHPLRALERAQKWGVREERAGLDWLVNAHQILEEDAPSSHSQMAHLTVAHDTWSQSATKNDCVVQTQLIVYKLSEDVQCGIPSGKPTERPCAQISRWRCCGGDLKKKL